MGIGWEQSKDFRIIPISTRFCTSPPLDAYTALLGAFTLESRHDSWSWSGVDEK